ncbi:MAG: hypothetical protein Q7R40_03540 [Phaeospirillum sp.]|nr:hypothetical protein [Phaeospirillum sp.]
MARREDWGTRLSDTIAVLTAGVDEARETRAAVLVEWNGEPMHVAESGAPGGYAFICDTGPTGATWFFSRNQKPSNWGIRVAVAQVQQPDPQIRDELSC